MGSGNLSTIVKNLATYDTLKIKAQHNLCTGTHAGMQFAWTPLTKLKTTNILGCIKPSDISFSTRHSKKAVRSSPQV